MSKLVTKKPFFKRPSMIAAGAVILLAVAGVGAWAYSANTEPEVVSTADSHVEKPKQKQPANQKDENPPETVPNEEKIIQPGADIDQGASPEKPDITRAEQVGDFLRVAIILKDPSNGSCTLRLEKLGFATVTKDAAVIVGPSYYTCNGFRVAKTDLATTGDWTATVDHKLNGKTSSSESRVIHVE